MTERHTTQKCEAPDEWYERERAAFIVWWESEGQKKFGETPTLAAGAGWLARAEAMSSETASRLAPPTEEEIAAYRDLFRSEIDKNMHNSSGSPSTDAHRVALHKFVEARNAHR